MTVKKKHVKAYEAQPGCRYYTMKGYVVEPRIGDHGRPLTANAQHGDRACQFYLVIDGVPDYTKVFPIKNGYPLTLESAGPPKKAGRKPHLDKTWVGWAHKNRRLMNLVLGWCKREGCFFIDKVRYINVIKDSKVRFVIFRAGTLGFYEPPKDDVIVPRLVKTGDRFLPYRFPFSVLEKEKQMDKLQGVILRLLV